MVIDLKVAQGCKNCGERHPACLHFHHIDPSEKEFRVNRAVAEKIPVPRILKEIEKCEVLCANCHAKVHWDEQKPVEIDKPNQPGEAE